MMRRNIVKKSVVAAFAAMMLTGALPVSAAELTEVSAPEALQPETAASESDSPEAQQQAMLMALTAQPVDHETALIQAEQAQIVLRGLALDKYHNINVLGDSITAGTGARTPDKAYPVILSRLTGANVNNYGLGCSGYSAGGIVQSALFYRQDVRDGQDCGPCRGIWRYE